MSDDNLENMLTCPITGQVFFNPVIASDGHTYERIAIEEWVIINSTSPLTREPLVGSFFDCNVTQKLANAYNLEHPGSQYKICGPKRIISEITKITFINPAKKKKLIEMINSKKIGMEDLLGMNIFYGLILNNYENVIKYLIDHVDDLNWKCPNKMALLHLFIIKNVPILYIKYIVEKGADIFLSGPSDLLPINFACTRCKMETIEYLVSKGADYTSTDELKQKALIHAVIGKNIPLANLLIENGTDTKFMSYGNSLITHAILGRPNPHLTLEMITILAKTGVKMTNCHIVVAICLSRNMYDILEDILEFNHFEPSMLSYSGEQKQVCSFINVNKCPINILKIIPFAINRNDINFMEKLLMNTILTYDFEKIKYVVDQYIEIFNPPIKIEIFSFLAEVKNTDFIIYYINKYPSIKTNDFNFLHKIFYNELFDVVKLVVDKGVDINSLSSLGGNVLIHFGVTVEIAQYLIDVGLNIHHVDNKGRNLFYNLKISSNRKLVELFVKHGVNINQVNHDLHSPLYYAIVNYKSEKIVKLFLKFGANKNIMIGKDTIFIYACKNRQLKIIKHLLNSGSNINEMDKYGYYPVVHILYNINITDKCEALSYFLKKGSDVTNLRKKNISKQINTMVTPRKNHENLVAKLVELQIIS